MFSSLFLPFGFFIFSLLFSFPFFALYSCNQLFVFDGLFYYFVVAVWCGVDGVLYNVFLGMWIAADLEALLSMSIYFDSNPLLERRCPSMEAVIDVSAQKSIYKHFRGRH